MTMVNICALTAVFFILSLEARVESDINEKRSLQVTFSTTSHNRIAVEGSSVEKVFGDGSLFSITLDSSTGCAFINVLKPISEKPVTLTVVTRSGLIQDLSVLAEDVVSEQIVLREREPEEIETIQELFHSPTVDLLNTILEGKIPLGYGFKANKEGSFALSLPSPIDATLMKVLEGPFEEIAVYTLKNRGKQPIVIQPRALKTEKMAWVFLNAHEIDKQEQLVCIVAYPKEVE